ncbi:MAG TPA: TonB-dependent receptor, partial [Gemmatimonadales bacterium]
MRPSRWTAMALLAGALWSMPGEALAQSGQISGRVVAREGVGVAAAQITVVDAAGRTAGTATTGDNGNFQIQGLAPGVYTVLVVAVGFQPARRAGVTVSSGGAATADFTMAAAVVELEEVVISVRGATQQKATVAPVSAHVINTTEVAERPALTVIDHLKSVPGVDISQGGLVQSNVVARGFNNIFSGAVLALTDYRYASVPSLRVNVPVFFPGTNDDIERIEFVLGPGAALYGPNAANGVLSVLTKSPFTSRGGILSLESGYRSSSRDAGGADLDDGHTVFRLSGRYAGTVGERLGLKASGDYITGQEWRYRDPAEPTSLPGRQCTAQFGCRDFDLEKWGVDLRADYRPAADAELVGAYGRSTAVNLIEYTGAGAAQAKDWSYDYFQLRGRWRRLFAQAFLNRSNSGNESATSTDGTFLLRAGDPIVDKSRVWAAQVQHGIPFGERFDLIYGVDYTYTDARTEGTINGRNEDDDYIREIGGYGHGALAITDRVELVGALRVDRHSRLPDLVWSPRAALVVSPTETQNLRVTYNRAFSTPTSNNLFLDLRAGSIPLGPGLAYTVRLLGVPEAGFHFRGYCGQGGVDDLCMRSPFPGTPATAFPALAAPLWPIAAGGFAQVVSADPTKVPALLRPFTQQIVTALGQTPAPGPTQVGTQLRRLDISAGVFNDIGADQVIDVEQLKPTISNVLEVGYKGIFQGRFRLSVDGWYERKENFIGPLIVESPNVFLDLLTTGQYLGANFAPRLVQILVSQGMSQQDALQVATGATQFVTAAMAGVSGDRDATGIPLGTVVPNAPLTQSSDIFLTYRNFGEVDLYGADIAVDYLFGGNRWSVSATYSWVSDDFFPRSEVGGPTDIALNASKSKGSVTGRYRAEDNGFSAELRGRYVKGFPVNSGVFVTPTRPDGSMEPIDSYGLVDVQASLRLPFAQQLRASLLIENFLNENYSTFVGVPQ